MSIIQQTAKSVIPKATTPSIAPAGRPTRTTKPPTWHVDYLLKKNVNIYWNYFVFSSENNKMQKLYYCMLATYIQSNISILLLLLIFSVSPFEGFT